jgi:ABC-type nitrate/sulfonate/bicarbonate transport system permease component
MDFILAMMVTTGVLGFCSDWIVLWIGNRFLRWSKGL